MKKVYIVQQDLKQDKRTKEYVNDLKEQRDKYKDALSVKMEEYEELKKNFKELDEFRTKQSMEYDLLVAEKESIEESNDELRMTKGNLKIEIVHLEDRIKELESAERYIKGFNDINDIIRGMKVNY